MKNIIIVALVIFVAFYGIAVYGGMKFGTISGISDYITAGFNKISPKDGTESEIKSLDLFTATNEFRKDHGVFELTQNSILSDLALSHAKSMYERGECDHLGFDERTETAEDSGFRSFAENAAFSSADKDAYDYIKQWEQSYGHYKNMLDRNMTHIGVAIYGGYAVQFFAAY